MPRRHHGCQLNQMSSAVIVVFDGLQPAQVTPELMPNLFRLASDGVTCTNHHAVFPTVTRANVASIVTGHQPGAHGLTANTLVIPEFDPYRAISALESTLSEVAAGAPVLLQPTLGDILHRHGLEYIAVGAGTTGNAYLQNPNAETGGGATIHPDFTLPRSLHAHILDRFGDWPDRRGPAAPKIARIVDVFTEYVLGERGPAVSLLWISEPDTSQHAHGVGSPESVAAIEEAGPPVRTAAGLGGRAWSDYRHQLSRAFRPRVLHHFRSHRFGGPTPGSRVSPG